MKSSLPQPLPIKAGIYVIRNLLTGDLYVGSAKSLRQRFYAHSSALKRKSHINPHLQNAYQRDGEEAFLFEVLEYVSDAQDLLAREQYYIDSLKPSYNIHLLARSALGIKRSEAFRERVGNLKRDSKHTEETKRKMSESLKAVIRTPEWNAKIGASLKDRKLSETHCLQISQAKKESPATRLWVETQAAAKKGHAPLKATEAAAKVNKGRSKTPEHRAKIAAAISKVPHTWGDKISEGIRKKKAMQLSQIDTPQ